MEPYLKGELPGVVVHAARVHQGQRVPHGVRVEHAVASRRADAAVSQRRRDHRARFRRHLNRTQLHTGNGKNAVSVLKVWYRNTKCTTFAKSCFIFKQQSRINDNLYNLERKTHKQIKIGLKQ